MLGCGCFVKIMFQNNCFTKVESVMNAYTFDVYRTYYELQMKVIRNLERANCAPFASPEQCWAIHEAYHSFKSMLEIQIRCYYIAFFNGSETSVSQSSNNEQPKADALPHPQYYDNWKKYLHNFCSTFCKLFFRIVLFLLLCVCLLYGYCLAFAVSISILLYKSEN